MELDDFVDLVDKLKGGAGSSAGQVLRGGALSGLMGSPAKAGAPSQATGGAGGGGKVLVKGSNTNITHSINEDERTEFTRHINQVRRRRANPPSAQQLMRFHRRRFSLEIPISEIDFPFPPILSKFSTNAEVRFIVSYAR